jgi:hypothetical protein
VYVGAGVSMGVALIVAGCSNDEAPVVGPQTTTPVLTRESYVKQANEICASADKQIVGLSDSEGPINDDGGVPAQDRRKHLLDSVNPAARMAIATLKNLTPPPEDAALLNGGIAEIEAAFAAAQASPTAPINPLGTPDQKLYDYGLVSCFSKLEP